MASQANIPLGILFGIINTMVLHLAKAMERHGIEAFSRDKSLKEKGKKPLIYVIGFILNNTVFVWQILGTTFASATVFSSVFGLGLILLMIYSHYILHEDISRIELIGAILIIVGTTSVGIVQIMEPPSPETVNNLRFYSLLIIISLSFIAMLIISSKKHWAIALIFGLIAGACGGIDNVFKRIGLKAGFSEIFNLGTFPIFMISFLIGFFAFLITQFGFAKGADASKLVPMYNSLYIVSPIIFELIIIEGAIISIGITISIMIIIIGVFFMNIFKKTEEEIV
jgi:drug/metabolite transporter (DMT)-like permease